VRWLGSDHQLGHRPGAAGRPPSQLAESALRTPRGERSPEHHQPTAGANEGGQLLGLPRPERLVTGGKDHPRAPGVECARIGDHLDVEVMRQLERAKQGPRQSRVIVGSAGEQRLHGHTTSHRR